MAEEPIVFDISAPGVQDVVDAFQQLGLSGETALNLVSKAAGNFTLDADKLAAIIQTVAEYMEAGGQAADVFENGLLKLSTSAIEFVRTQTDLISGLKAMQVASADAAAAATGLADAHVKAYNTMQEVQRIYFLNALEEEAGIAEIIKSESDARLAQSVQAMELIKAEEEAYSIKASLEKDMLVSQASAMDEAYSVMSLAVYLYAQKVSAAYEAIQVSARTAQDIQVQAAIQAAAAAEDAAKAVALFNEQNAMGSARAAELLLQDEAIAFDQLRTAAIGAAEGLKASMAAEDAMEASLSRAVGVTASATAMVIEYRNANMTAVVSVEELGAAVVASGEAFQRSTGFITGVIGQLGLFFTAAAAIKDINVTDKLQTQLIATTGSVDAANAEFELLYKTAQATATPIAETAKLFSQLNAVLSTQGYTTDQVSTATDTLAKVLRGTGVAGENTGRVMHELQEIVSGSANSQRAWNSIMAQAPALGAKLAEILDYDASAHDKNNVALTKAQTNLDNFNQKQALAGVSVTSATSAVKTASAALSEYTAKQAINNEGKTASTKDQQLENLELTKLRTNLANARSELATATSVQGQANDKKKQALQLAVQTAQSAVTERTALKLTTDAAQEQANQLNANAEANVSISDSFTRLNNSFERYLKDSGDASVVSKTFSDVLGFIGNHFNVIVPLAILLGAAFAVLKVAQLAVDFASLATRLVEYAAAAGTSGVATLLFDAALTPLGLTIIGITAAIVGILAATGKLTPAFNAAVDEVKSIGAAFFGTSAYADELKQKTDANATSVTGLLDKIGGTSGLTSAISGTAGLNTALTAANTNLDKGITQLTNYGNAAAHTTAQLDALVGAEQLAGKLAGSGNGGQNINNPFNATSASGLDPSADYDGSAARAAANAAAASRAGLGAGGAYGIQGFKTGGTFTVPGSGAPDSKAIAVSPGEHVTIQTPEQHYAGKVNTSNTSGAYATGGIFGLASSQSTTGYTALTDTDYYTSGAAPTASSSASAAANDNTATSVASTKSAASSATNTAQSIVDASRSSDSAGNVTYTGTSGGGPLNVSGGSQGGTPTSFTQALQTYNSNLTSWKATIESDKKALSAAQVVTAIDGVAKPADGSNVSTIEQAQKWVIVNGAWTARQNDYPGVPTTAGDASAAYAQYLKDMAAQPPYPARDGLDVTIPGGSGTDSRLVSLAVSPGEKLSVRTPQQQQAEGEALQGRQGAGAGGRGVVNMTVYTKDANSFGQSQSQLLAAAKRKQARV